MKKLFLSYTLIIFLAVIAYGNSIPNQFAYDDISVVKENRFITKLSNIQYLFSLQYFDKSGEKSYRPLVTLSYIIDYALFGTNPYGYHAVNVLLHIIAALLVFLIAQRLLDNNAGALLAGLLFCCHPLMTEAVCSITFREDILCALFFLIGLWSYLVFRQSGSPRLLGIMLASYLLSLLSKEMGLAFVPAVGVYELFYRKKPRNRAVYISCLVGIVIVTVFFLLIRFAVMKNPDDIYLPVGFSMSTAILTMLTYVQLYFYPIKLRALYYDTELFNHWREIILCASAFVIIIATIIRLKRHDKKQALLYMSLCGICFLPVMNIYPIRHLIAERYTYLPAFGMICFTALMFSAERFIAKPKCVLILLVCVITLFCARTVARNTNWKNNFSLWQKTVRDNPWLAEAQYSLAHAYQSDGKIDKAIRVYHTALRLKPDYFDVLVNLGRAYVEKGLLKTGITIYFKALKQKPDNALLNYNLGIACDKAGKDDKALYYFNKCIDIDPSDPKVYGALGAFYIQRNESAKAEFYWKKSIEASGDYAQGYANLGSLYANRGDYSKAMFFWRKALSVDPNYTSVKQKIYMLRKELRTKYKDNKE